MTAALRILMVEAGAAPGHPDALDLAEERRQIDSALATAPYGQAIDIQALRAARREDFVECLLPTPEVLHISGHADSDGALRFRTDDGGTTPVVRMGLSALLLGLRPPPTLIFLNGCHTADLAAEIVADDGCAIGVAGTISNTAAVAFSRTFYSMVARGASVASAHQMAQNALLTYGATDREQYRLIPGKNMEASACYLVPPEARPPSSPPGVKPRSFRPTGHDAKQRVIALIDGSPDAVAGMRSLMSSTEFDIAITWMPIDGFSDL
ncbi:hypothetical protein KGA66_23470 [Actinocrinis puniceicyclus]|uniref:CHAT domain-containing protein n=1 Tax=Actinocrinis puniceicyclus TaxID=977794 RepID=A0A8J8BGQ8_9ACTN|nr:CHAT domain-containing protein [Actinocrinis puniceicyclus]MBS2966024.1 hypothetical protein [Actinocrinis puniceicyclus]